MVTRPPKGARSLRMAEGVRVSSTAPAGLRRLAVLASVLLATEGIAILADHHWSFRARLLSAFDTATRANVVDEDHKWADPDRPFAASHDPSTPPLRFRGPRSSPCRIPSLYGLSLSLNKRGGGVLAGAFFETVVIANEAKQSPRREDDCFVAALLAMTPEH